MNRKKLCLLLASMTMSISFCAVAIFANKNGGSIYAEKAVENKIVLNSSKNKFHNNSGSTAYSGEATAQTNLGNDIDFSYTDLMGLATTWHVAKTGGGFYNIDPIHGLESISLSFKTNGKEFKLYWSSTTSFTEYDSQSFVSSTTSSTVFDFGDEYPTHFKFVNTSESNLNVSEVEIGYSCQNNYPTLTVSTQDEIMGIVSGDSGIIRSGENVLITASPNQGYKFIGWYSGDDLISSDSNYNFVMGYEDLDYVAHFTYESYNFIVQSESNSKGTVSDLSGSYDYLTFITIEATTNDGYTFTGWYSGDNLVSTSNPYTFNMPYSNTSYTAKFSTNSYDLTLVNANPTLGNISSSNFYLYGSSVTIVAAPNTGISFLGWYDMDDNLISSLSSYTFDMPHEDLIYIAKFEWTPYLVNLTINDSTMGSVSGGGSYVYQQEVTLVATPNDHYSFFGWYDKGVLLSQESTYTFDMPDESLSYQARFVRNYNLYIYSDDESKGTVSFPNEWGIGLDVTINANAEIGYALDYWYDDDLNEVSYDSSYTFVMPKHDVRLYAAFTTGYTLTVTSSDTLKGTVSGSGQYVAGRNVTVTMNYISGIIKGWFDENDQLVSKNNPYEFLMPSNNYSLEARFLTSEEEIERDKAHGIIPVLSNDSQTITYGLYPQTNVNDESLINSLNSLKTPTSNGWYLFEDEYYTKIKATPYMSNYYFENGTKIVRNTTYWFKCELISWNILSNSEEKYYIVSTTLLDAHDYAHSVASGHFNYKFSQLRSWLNDDFYNCAFAFGNDYIQTTIVDNSAATTCVSTNRYACENTEDKVFLPSYQDYLNSNYGFSTSTDSSYTRFCKTSDWARARGAMSTTSDDDFKFNGCYWTRSPYNYFQEASCIRTNGDIFINLSVATNYVSARPALIIAL